MSQTADLPKIRPLGTFEHFRAVLHDLGFHYNVALAAHYTHPNDELDRSDVYNALKGIIARLPPLSVTIRGLEGNAPYLARLPEIQLANIVRWVDRSDSDSSRDALLDEILSEENSKGFDVQSLDPLWRIVVLTPSKPSDGRSDLDSGYDIIFVWHHAIGDGHSGLAVLYAILDALNNPSLGSLPPGNVDSAARVDGTIPSVVCSSKDPAPALESLLKMQPSLRKRVHRLSVSYLGDWSTKPVSKKWSGGFYANNAPIRTNIRHVRVPAQSLSGILTKCRNERTSMTAFLQTLIGNILFCQYRDAERLMCATAISLRRFISPSNPKLDDMTMGMWVSAFHIEYSRPPSLATSNAIDWSMTRKNKGRIDQEIAKGDKDIETGALRDVGDFKKFLLDKIGKERADSFAVTNLSVVKSHGLANAGSPTKKPSGWKISDVVFSQSCHVNGSAIQFCIISTENGDLVISLSSQEGIVALQDLETIADQLKKDLIHIGHLNDLQTPKPDTRPATRQ